jgi:hypothetical protein
MIERVSDQLPHCGGGLRAEMDAIGREPTRRHPSALRGPIGDHELGVGPASKNCIALAVTPRVAGLSIGQPDHMFDPLAASLRDDHVHGRADPGFATRWIVVPGGDDQSAIVLSGPFPQHRDGVGRRGARRDPTARGDQAPAPRAVQYEGVTRRQGCAAGGAVGLGETVEDRVADQQCLDADRRGRDDRGRRNGRCGGQ